MTGGAQVRDRNGLEVIPAVECWELLASERMGRIALVTSGAPLVFPIHFGIHHGNIVFRSTPGTKLSQAAANAAVAFEIDGHDDVNHAGWSVIVTGRATIVLDEDERRDLDHLPVAWWRHQHADWIKIEPESVTGRRIENPAFP